MSKTDPQYHPSLYRLCYLYTTLYRAWLRWVPAVQRLVKLITAVLDNVYDPARSTAARYRGVQEVALRSAPKNTQLFYF